MLAILLLVAVFSRISEITGTMPYQSKNCDYDAFISSEPFGGKVFLHPSKLSERHGDWYQARGFCAEHCAEMVTIHSEAENTFFLDFMRSVGMTQAVWLGAQVVDRQDFRTWSNGQPSTYSKKYVTEYDQIGLTCVNAAAVLHLNFWFNYLCSHILYLVACQRPADYSFCE